MCAVSMVYEHYSQQGPQTPVHPTINSPCSPLPWPQALPSQLPWTNDILDELKKVIERIDRIDKALGLPDCHDLKKAKWMKKI